VKIFPAHHFGPKYLEDLGGPFPGVPLVPSGGVSAGNARRFLAAGALAVSAGTDVVSPADVLDRRWADITARASAFCAALR
jgi:2-dehydro-3-deoxyphosphogluconate aldolase / (4S)-4-hydroxy-2-oxoglutarate aldolase